MEIYLAKKFRCSCTARRSLVFSVGIMILFLITASWFLVSFRSLIFRLRAEVAEDIQAMENATKIDSGDRSDGRLILDAGDIALAQSKESAKAEFGFDKFPLVVKTAEDPKPYQNSTKTVTGRLDSNTSTWTPARQRPSSHASNSGKAMFGDCDLYHGKWIYDPTGPLYTNSTCPILTQSQNCQGNGRPDKGYENWRWKPDQCNIPRFDARKFLEMMKGKILAFIGDSVARNQMESMLCILWQVETPRMRGNRRMHRWYFRSTSTTIVRIWSSWLVGKSTDASAPRGVVRVHLDKLDEAFFEFLPMFDVVVLSSGHWFSKRSIYLINGEIVGSQLWHSERSQKNHINSMSAYTIAMETILTAIATHPNYTGVTILRTYSPAHYKGGSCSNNGEPAKKPAGNGHTAMMHYRQVEGFKAAVEKVKNGSKLRLMDITEVFGYRHDGHPGRYRSPDAKNSKGRHLSGKTQTEDCLHWCMLGPVDVWNEILFEILKRELQVAQVKI